MVGTEKGPQRSQCTRSKRQWDTWVLIGEDIYIYFFFGKMTNVTTDCFIRI